MATRRLTLDPTNPPKMTPGQKAALDAMTDERITAAALSDPENPPLSDEEIDRFTAARIAKRARKKLALSQVEFAARYHIGYGRLRDIERGRSTRPDTALIAYLKVIENEPDAVTRALGGDKLGR